MRIDGAHAHQCHRIHIDLFNFLDPGQRQLCFRLPLLLLQLKLTGFAAMDIKLTHILDLRLLIHRKSSLRIL